MDSLWSGSRRMRIVAVGIKSRMVLEYPYRYRRQYYRRFRSRCVWHQEREQARLLRDCRSRCRTLPAALQLFGLDAQGRYPQRDYSKKTDKEQIHRHPLLVCFYHALHFSAIVIVDFLFETILLFSITVPAFSAYAHPGCHDRSG